ncbi:uncharacterized protein L969DRAFT_82994 [Mixia osmundae IAM 14324]|uniref:EamA domain-containing protein n=1 Tax=Mixia osmundae (strain CBS 9802 / IAM 14324 / JCM 22182 / KY 12970) TaxID=764103 RepID=G7EA66_MIXOS|nr:uncharacterized protein L969DRAFT_82994 [Mixia osmundae IAM 14324]KEI37624.1 hypothetical protein L969DRAFT_82994 [Mixia osmundae IAM 14324]GAA99726.1 hypothetical protein E5Q_06429 [Mixia osmundae IAM 14324]
MSRNDPQLALHELPKFNPDLSDRPKDTPELDTKHSSGGIEQEQDCDSKSLASARGPSYGATGHDGLATGLKHAVIDGRTVQRPKVVFNQGMGTFFSTLLIRLRSIFTLRFIAVLVGGQVLSLCITSTSTATTELALNGWVNLPLTQNLFNYVLINLIYTSYTIYKYGIVAWLKMIKTDGWKYCLLAVFDVEGNYSVVKAYQYTDLLSASLLDAWATPVAMVACYFLVKARYHWSQILGVLVCIAGLGLLVASDTITGKNYQATNKGLGDGLMIIGASCYGISNALEEKFIRGRPLYEVVGQLGFWATLICGIQAAGVEHSAMPEAVWNGTTVGYLLLYTFSLTILYTCAPLLFRYASAPFYNISLLTSDFYLLCIGITVFHYYIYWLYIPAFILVIVGLVIYFSVSPPESQGENDIQTRGKQAVKDEKRDSAELA